MKTQRTIADAWRASKTDGNNFDFIRFIAAAAVIGSHSFELTAGAGAAEPLRILTEGDVSLGGLAVQTFFVLSGFLLAASWRSDPDLLQFAVKRGLRIAPALMAVVLICVFALGPAFTTLTPAAYFASPDTWRYLANLGLYTGHTDLPGVFENLPYPDTINGPLWTLKFEVMCYGALALAGVMKALRLAVVLPLIAFLYLVDALGGGGHAGAAYYLFKFADLGRAFFAGAALFLLADRAPLDGRIAALCAGLLAAATPPGLLGLLFPLAGGYLVIYLGFARLGPLRHAAAHGDLSYGLYLWGWPVQQILIWSGLAAGWALNFLFALPVAALCAFASWRLVEAPALRLKSRLSRATTRGAAALGAN